MNGTGQAVATNRHTSNSQQRGFGPSRTARALLVALVAVPSLLIGLACSESVPTTQPRPIATIEAGYTPTPPPTERGPGFPPPARPTSTAAGSQPGLQVLPSVDEVFVNESVDFLLTDTETGELVERPSWRIVSFHNVPGDRGIMRSDGRYTAPRIAPYPPTVQIEGRSEGRRVSAEFLIVNPDWPPGGTLRPGDSHTHPVHGIPEFKTSRPIDDGLPAGESVRITPLDRTGRPLLVSHYEVKHRDRVVSYAGSITQDGVYHRTDLRPEALAGCPDLCPVLARRRQP